MGSLKASLMNSLAPAQDADGLYAFRAGGIFGKLVLSDFRAQRRNFLINGSCRVAQRNSLVVNAVGNRSYAGCDQIAVSNSGFGSVQYIILQADLGFSFGASGFAQQIGNISSTGAGSLTYDQRIEAVTARMLSGRTVTLSALVLQQTGAPINAQLVFRQPNAPDNYAVVNLVSAKAAAAVPNNVPTRLTYTVTLPNVSNGLQCDVLFSGLGAYAGTAQIFLMDFLLEIGTSFTQMEGRPIAEELMLCQRYCESFDTNTATVGLPAFLVGTNLARTSFAFKVRKRANPSATIIPANVSINFSAGNVTPSSASVLAGVDGGVVDFTTPTSPFIVGQAASVGIISKGVIFEAPL